MNYGAENKKVSLIECSKIDDCLDFFINLYKYYISKNAETKQ